VVSLVTVGLPFTGSPNGSLELAVRSVFAQDLYDWRLLLVSDGAPEAVLSRLSAIADERVTVIHDGERRGLASRLNQIARMCDSQYLARMDDDDVMSRSRLSQQLHAIQSRNVDIVASRAYALKGETELLGLFREPTTAPLSDSDFLQKGAFTHPSVMGTAEWFKQHPYDEALLRGEDKDLWIRTRSELSAAKLAEPLLYYRLGRLDATKQRRDAAVDRRLVARYGPEMIGVSRTKKYLIKSRFRQFVFGVAARLPRASEMVLRSKAEPMDDQRVRHAMQELEEIKKTVVPGW